MNTIITCVAILGIMGAEYAVKEEGALFNSFAASDNPYNFIDVSALSGAQSYTLRADAHTAEGSFLGWVDQNGNVVSPARIMTITFSSAGYIVDGKLSTFDDSVTTLSPAYGAAAVADMVTYQGGDEVAISTHGALTQSFKTDADGNRYVNFKKYKANGQTNESKMAIVHGIADTLEVGKTYAVEFDVRFNDFINAVYTVDGDKYTVTNMGSSWWSYAGFISDIGGSTPFADANGITINNTSTKTNVTLTNGSKKDIYPAEKSTFLGKTFKLEDYSDWMTVRAEIDIVAADGDSVTELTVRFYVNGTLTMTADQTKTKSWVNKLKLSNGLEAFYFKFKSMNASTKDQRINGYDFDVDNAVSFVYDTIAN